MRITMRALILLIFSNALLSGALAQENGCGGPDTPCIAGEAEYLLALPPAPDGAPVIIFLHGYAATPKAVIKNTELVEAFTSRGFAFVAPTGQVDIGNPKALDWGVHDGHRWPRDDAAVLEAVKADALARFGFDANRVFLAGYSRGGSLVWDIACRNPDFALGYASASGAFWEPMWRRCKGPVHMRHSHGFADRTVPLEGREVTFGGFEFEQGSVLKSLHILAETNGCGQMADTVSTKGARWNKAWTKCSGGSLVFSLGPNGHGRQPGWADNVAEWFTTLPATGTNPD